MPGVRARMRMCLGKECQSCVLSGLNGSSVRRFGDMNSTIRVIRFRHDNRTERGELLGLQPGPEHDALVPAVREARQGEAHQSSARLFDQAHRKQEVASKVARWE